jgi:hypothetical protein
MSQFVMPFALASGMRKNAMMADTKASPDPTQKGPLFDWLAGNWQRLGRGKGQYVELDAAGEVREDAQRRSWRGRPKPTEEEEVSTAEE